MAHGLTYKCEFDALTPTARGYRLEFLFKDYVGDVTDLIAAGVPVIHKWLTDEPKPAVKGSSIDIRIINEGDTPINLFYANADTDIQVKFWHESNLLFIGFLVQDDCSEILLDSRHELQLSANDGLGLLKDIKLDANKSLGILYAWQKYGIAQTAPDTVFIPIYDEGKYLPYRKFGETEEQFDIIGTSFDDIHGATAVNVIAGAATITVSDVITTESTEDGVIAHYQTIDFNGRNNLLTIIGVCLYHTGLQLKTTVYANIFETRQDETLCFLQQTYIDTNIFLNGNDFDSCYAALEKICKAFNLSIFQAYGQWQVVRWDELNYFTGGLNIPGTIHEWSDMEQSGTTNMNGLFELGTGLPMYPVTGITRSITRPFEYSKRTFNYEQPKYLMYNYDLQTVGAVLNTVTSGTTFQSFLTDSIQLIFGVEYEITSIQPFDDFTNVGASSNTNGVKFIATGVNPEDWFNGSILTIRRTVTEYEANVNNGFITNRLFGGADSDIFIRVVYDGALEVEEQRYLVLKGGVTAADQASIKYIEIDKNDKIEFYASVRTVFPQSNPTTITSIVRVEYGNGGGNFIRANGNSDGSVSPSWVAGMGGGWNTVIDEDTQQWHDIKVTPPITTQKGLLEIWLNQVDDFGGPTAWETHYRDIRLVYKPQINESLKVDGHTHLTEQDLDIKNNESIEIQIDDAPRNAINGVLFLAGFEDSTQIRTVKWYRMTGTGPVVEERKLEDIITHEQMYWRQQPRAKIEGDARGIVRFDDRHISMLAVLKYTDLPDLEDAFFVFGTLQIDYRNNQFNCTMWEIGKDGEAANETDYSFNYLYSK